MLLRDCFSKPLLTFCLLVFVSHTAVSQTDKPRRLALLVAAPWEREQAMHNDVIAMYTVLRLRGFSSDEILVLEGSLNRDLLLAFLREAGKRITGWDNGEVFLYYTAHGML